MPTVVVTHILGESSKVSPTSIESQPTVTLVDIMAQLTALTQTISEVHKDQKADHGRLAKIETAREPPKIEEDRACSRTTQN